MAPLPPPQGMSDADYETIEAAVTETVRGRWFLGEFARRNRTGEMKQLLDAMARLEGMVGASAQPALPPADPSIRLLMQRIKEIAAQLDGLSAEMRDAGIDPRFPEAVEHQARAVNGMMRGPGQAPSLPPRATTAQPPRFPASRPALPQAAPSDGPPDGDARSVVAPPATRRADPEPPPATAAVRLPRADLPPGLERDATKADPRLAALSALDGLSLAKKLALFS